MVWQCRRASDGGVKCDEVSIRDVGVEERFYGDIDPLVTKQEKEYLPLHKKLLETQLGSIPITGIPEFLTHLEVRSIAVRRMGELFAKTIQDEMLTEDKIRSIYAARLRARGELVDEKALTEFIRGQMTEVNRKGANRAALLGKKAQSFHNKTIGTCPLPTGKIEQYAEFQYRIVGCEGEPFVLGDGAIFFRHGERLSNISFPFLKVEEVWLPLSPTRCLTGVRGESKSSSAKVPEYAAATACQFFVSGSNAQTGLGRHIASGITATAC